MKKRSVRFKTGILALLIMTLCLALTGCSELWDITESILTEAAESAEEEAESRQKEVASEEEAESRQKEDTSAEEAELSQGEEASAESGYEEASEDDSVIGPGEEGTQDISDTANNDPLKGKAVKNDAIKEGLRFRNKKLLDQHYEKHGREMGFSSPEEYEKAAAKVPANENALHKIEAEDGDDVYYVEESNEFAVVSTDGYIRTYFEPNSGKKYFDRQ